MNISQELRILILQLIAKHPTLKDDYSLMRYFAKSSVMPDKLISAKADMVDQDLIFVKEVKNTVKYYEITKKGLQLLDSYDLEDYLRPFALEIDKSGYILKIIRLVEDKTSDKPRENGG
jgi:DNA-binding PadR family transcriptional regulator